MNVLHTDDAYAFAEEAAFYGKARHTCTVCEREILSGESCYCFEGETVCEDCANAYVIDRYWYATPEDI